MASTSSLTCPATRPHPRRIKNTTPQTRLRCACALPQLLAQLLRRLAGYVEDTCHGGLRAGGVSLRKGDGSRGQNVKGVLDTVKVHPVVDSACLGTCAQVVWMAPQMERRSPGQALPCALLVYSCAIERIQSRCTVVPVAHVKGYPAPLLKAKLGAYHTAERPPQAARRSSAYRATLSLPRQGAAAHAQHGPTFRCSSLLRSSASCRSRSTTPSTTATTPAATLAPTTCTRCPVAVAPWASAPERCEYLQHGERRPLEIKSAN